MNQYLIQKLKEGRLNKGLKQSDVTKLTGIKNTTLSNYENGNTEPDMDTFLKLCHLYELDYSELLGEAYGYHLPGISIDIKKSDINMLKKYRSLDDYGKELVNLVLDKENERCQNHTPAAIIELSPTNKFFPYYGKIASAGKGFEFSDIIDTDGGAEYPLTKVNRLADYTIGVSGDSMEPVYYDGDIVFVKRVYDLEYGDVGIFQKDNEILIKQVGKNELLSFNPKYPPIPDNGDIRCLGKVLGKVDENCT